MSQTLMQTARQMLRIQLFKPTGAHTMKIITTAAARLIGYATHGHGFGKTHYSLTRREALTWAHCYPAATVTRWGQFVASTTTKGA